MHIRSFRKIFLRKVKFLPRQADSFAEGRDGFSWHMPREYGTLFFLQDLNGGFFHSFVLKGAGFLILDSPRCSAEMGCPPRTWAFTD